MNPEGDYCAICYSTFKHGGFAAQSRTLRVFRGECKKNTDLIDEFMAARSGLDVLTYVLLIVHCVCVVSSTCLASCLGVRV